MTEPKETIASIPWLDDCIEDLIRRGIVVRADREVFSSR